MSNQYLYPQNKFTVNLNLEVDVKFVGMWKGFDQKIFNERYQEMLQDGSFVALLKEEIVYSLECMLFDCIEPEPFDRLCFEVKEVKND